MKRLTEYNDELQRYVVKLDYERTLYVKERTAPQMLDERLKAPELPVAYGAIVDKLAYYENLQAEGRLQIRKCAYGTGCGACAHWHRIEGTRRGTCDLRAKCRDKFGRETAGAFEPSQSRRVCKDYERKETRAYEGNV